MAWCVPLRAVQIVLLYVPLVVRGGDSAQRAGPRDGDTWVTAGVLPTPWRAFRADTNAVGDLRAEALAGRLLVNWKPADTGVMGAALFASTDYPGHWPARDWKSVVIRRRGDAWQADVPVESLDVPLAYFLVATNSAGVVVSPVRLCRPRALGLEEPTRYFWPFLEGFEQGLESWRSFSEAPLGTSRAAKNGRASLRVTVAPGKESALVGTTRVRGWLLEERAVRGIAIWLRSDRAGRARFSFLSHAFTTNQLVAEFPRTVPVGNAWQKAELHFDTLSAFKPAELDLVTIEFHGAAGTEFLLDDLSLLGRWRLDLE